MGRQQTTKKVKYVGTQQYLNVNTGELEDFNVTGIEDRDFNFHKVWMRNFISTLDIVGNQKTKLCFWIIDNLNRENQLLYTYRQIAEKSGISLDTVRITMGILLDSDFLRRHNQGCYIVNPDIVFKGTRTGRLNILNQYQESERVELTDEEKLANVMQGIKNMQKSMDKLLREATSLQKKISDKQNQVENQMCIQDIDMNIA